MLVHRKHAGIEGVPSVPIYIQYAYTCTYSFAHANTYAYPHRILMHIHIHIHTRTYTQLLSTCDNSNSYLLHYASEMESPEALQILLDWNMNGADLRANCLQVHENGERETGERLERWRRERARSKRKTKLFQNSKK